MKEKKKDSYKNKRCDWCDAPTINTDPQGSYTGVSTEDKYELPVQDADDL